MAGANYVNGILRERWDDAARTYTVWDSAGRLVSSRVYTAAENAAAEGFIAEAAAQENRTVIEQRAQSALETNRAFLAVTSPTDPQVVAQVQALSRQTNGVIRLLLGQLDATD